MNDNVVEAAGDYAEHTTTCHTCCDYSHDLCPKGLALMKAFHDALNHMMNQKYTDA